MTDQRELDRVLDAFFVDGTNELAGRVIDAALERVDRTQQRRAVRLPRWLPTKTRPALLAAAAVIGALAVGATFYLIRPSLPAVGGPSSSPSVSAGPGETARPSSVPSSPVVLLEAPTWTATGNMSEARANHTATLLHDGRVLVEGGSTTNDGSTSAELYDPRSGSWTATRSRGDNYGGLTATLLQDGTVLVTGGSFSGDADLYDPSSGSWTSTGSMVVNRVGHTATLLPDGKVLVAGGGYGRCNDTGALASSELYDPTSGSWTPTGNMSGARTGHTATLLPDGRVLVTGGDKDGCGEAPLASAELFDPVAGSWTVTGSTSEARTYHTATLLSDGRVLVVGGGCFNCDRMPLASAELYDPRSGSWTPTGSMGEARTYHTATLLTDGTVLAAGGTQRLASAELYDPSTGSWTATARVDGVRFYHTATLLPDGKVLVAGGKNWSGLGSVLGTTQLYNPNGSRPTATAPAAPTPSPSAGITQAPVPTSSPGT